MSESGTSRYGRHQRLAKALLRPLFRLLWPITVSGGHNIPATGPAVLCPNHLAAIDSFVLPAVLSRPVIFVGKAEYLDDWKTRWLFPALGMIPIDRRGGRRSEAALEAARAVLQSGGLFAIYPEGTRSRTGKLHRGHTGAARLAVECGAPIIPIGIVGTDDIQPVGTALPRLFRRAEVRVGTPIDVERYRARIGDRAIYRELIDEVMYEIGQLTGQEYVHLYAGDRAASAPAVAPTTAPTTDDEPAVTDREATVPRRSSADVLVSRPLVTS